MNAELLPLTPTTDQRAKMAYVYIRQSSLMQVTRHGESTDLQYSLVQRAVALGWPRERVELIDEDLGKSGAHAEARGGFQRLLAEISLARVGLVLSFDASRLARNNRDFFQWGMSLGRLGETFHANRNAPVCFQQSWTCLDEARSGSIEGRTQCGWMFTTVMTMKQRQACLRLLQYASITRTNIGLVSTTRSLLNFWHLDRRRGTSLRSSALPRSSSVRLDWHAKPR
jgi:hypothetical protein